MNNKYIDLLKQQFNNRVDIREKRPGIYQLIAPFYYEDGDMMDIFIQESSEGKLRICDYGMALMRLSYSYDTDTPNREKIFNRILTENNLSEDNGNIYIDIDPEKLYMAVLQFTQTISKVSNMSQFKREVIQSLFYEMLEEFICTDLAKYNPVPKVLPIQERDELEVDFAFNTSQKPIYLFGVKGTPKARLSTICCLEFLKAGLPFRSIIVHEEFDALPKKDRKHITSAADKQFVNLEDFQENGKLFLERETA